MPDRSELDNEMRVTALSLSVSLTIAEEAATADATPSSTTARTILRASKFEDYLRNGKL